MCLKYFRLTALNIFANAQLLLESQLVVIFYCIIKANKKIFVSYYFNDATFKGEIKA